MTKPQSFDTYDKQNFRPSEAHAQRVDLPPGAYGLHSDDRSVFFRARKMTTDELIHSKDPREVALREEVITFFASAHLYEKHGFAHRRGVLLHGPAGSGKSCLLRSFCEEQIKAGNHVFLVDHSNEPGFIHGMLQILQHRQPGAKVIIVIEELEEFVGRRGEHSLLSILDGELALEGALVVATTNYPEKLNKRLLNRPRRFDRVLFVGMPGEDVRREYFHKKLNIDSGELDEWVAASADFSFAGMADLVISNKCLGIPLQKAAASIRAMMDANPHSEWVTDRNPEPVPYAVFMKRVEVLQATPAPPTKPHPFTASIIDRIEESAGISQCGADTNSLG